ncbi:prenyltransferase/squalene oxidase repeat-containing protein [Robiginitomaculum antarcticum]|uniref:hypothetical protein n=1 Tax=Robiginitomaculum antarcticum TaxID=437507 RepID=UPI0003764B44|nr:hypothetical protein [Robiginitomaculum antarcticum]
MFKEKPLTGKINMMYKPPTVFTHGLLRKTSPMAGLQMHQSAAINWLKRAHDATPDDGVGYGYYLRGYPFRAYGFGWRPSYVETSGYIVETFYDIATAYDDADASIRAERIGRWLLTMQNQDGSFPNNRLNDLRGIVFDTGQVLFGLLRCYRETGDIKFQLASQKAADWLTSQLDKDGVWRKHTHLSNIHTYNTRVAWALLEYHKTFPHEGFDMGARQNLYWAISQQTDIGLFRNCSFKKGHAPHTHTIAYAIRGLFEGGLLLGDERILSASLKAALYMAEYVDETGFIPGRVSEAGIPYNAYSCLTGNCQLAIIWFKMSQYFNYTTLNDKAGAALDYVIRRHNVNSRNKNIRGAVKGSQPIWGGYTPLAYPNWAAKFLIDAILIKESMPES